MRVLIGTVVVLTLTGAAHAAPKYPIDVAELVAASQAENELCRDQPGGSSISDSACARRDELSRQLAHKGWCWGPDDAIEADKRWMKCGPTARP